MLLQALILPGRGGCNVRSDTSTLLRLGHKWGDWREPVDCWGRWERALNKSIPLLFWARIPWASCKAQFPENGTQQLLDSQAVRRNPSEIHDRFLFLGLISLFCFVAYSPHSFPEQSYSSTCSLLPPAESIPLFSNIICTVVTPRIWEIILRSLPISWAYCQLSH